MTKNKVKTAWLGIIGIIVLLLLTQNYQSRLGIVGETTTPIDVTCSYSSSSCTAEKWYYEDFYGQISVRLEGISIGSTSQYPGWGGACIGAYSYIYLGSLPIFGYGTSGCADNNNCCQSREDGSAKANVTIYLDKINRKAKVCVEGVWNRNRYLSTRCSCGGGFDTSGGSSGIYDTCSDWQDIPEEEWKLKFLSQLGQGGSYAGSSSMIVEKIITETPETIEIDGYIYEEDFVQSTFASGNWQIIGNPTILQNNGRVVISTDGPVNMTYTKTTWETKDMKLLFAPDNIEVYYGNQRLFVPRTGDRVVIEIMHRALLEDLVDIKVNGIYEQALNISGKTPQLRLEIPEYTIQKLYNIKWRHIFDCNYDNVGELLIEQRFAAGSTINISSTKYYIEKFCPSARAKVCSSEGCREVEQYEVYEPLMSGQSLYIDPNKFSHWIIYYVTNDKGNLLPSCPLLNTAYNTETGDCVNIRIDQNGIGPPTSSDSIWGLIATIWFNFWNVILNLFGL